MRSSRRCSETRWAVVVMRFSGASTRPAITQPIAVEISTIPAKAIRYWSATLSSVVCASGGGSVRSKWRSSSQ
jgi:hypothetical protein